MVCALEASSSMSRDRIAENTKVPEPVLARST
jgi:hypothetical protein